MLSIDRDTNTAGTRAFTDGGEVLTKLSKRNNIGLGKNGIRRARRQHIEVGG